MRKEPIRENRVGDVQYAILAAIGFAGILAMVVVAPNALRLLKYVENGITHVRKRKPHYAISRSAKSLIRQGLVEYADSKRDAIKLTKEGKRLLYRIDIGKIAYKKPDVWDGKWRAVVFDILEKHRYKRDGLRRILQHIGFLRFQDSVWIFPYHCERLVELLKIEQDLGRSVAYMLVEKIEDDAVLKKKFDL